MNPLPSRCAVSVLRPLVVVFVALTALTGVAYPLAVTGLALALFPDRAAGSLVRVNGQIVGSRLVGQRFDAPGDFWGRPSAGGYDARASGGTNDGPLHPDVAARARARLEALGVHAPVPVDLLTASASGLDPHISPEGALVQVPRVAAARGLAPAAVRALVEANVEPRTLGVFGEPRVNVLALNLALDRADP